MKKHLISLPEKMYLVVGDKFELFYRGVVRMHNPYQYYVKATCEKGFTYNRYFTYTPKVDEVGEYKLTIALYNDFGEVIESKDTMLIVNEVTKPNKKINVLCIGDSLTYNGVWPNIGYTRFSEKYPDSLNFIGKMKKDQIGYEGYGGWQWKTFCTDNKSSYTSSVWVKAKHNLTYADQHSVWKSNDLEWILETIEIDRLKFKRGIGNAKVNPALGDKLTHVSNATNTNDIIIESYEYSEGNPFWNEAISDIDFSNYIKVNGFPKPDLIFTLLSWNGQYIPYNEDFSVHNEYARKIINRLHLDFPDALIGVMGIQLPCPNGGITACYGASGYYHDWYGETITAFNYDEWLEALTKTDEYKDYVFYFDVKSLFDSEYNYYTADTLVNNRSKVTERVGVNGIHPSLDGYNQMGDIFYKALVEMVKKVEKK